MPEPFLEVVNGLFKEMDLLVPPASYPAHVLPISERIDGTAFFPGGSGLYLEKQEKLAVKFPFGGVMILGHNFDAETGFEKSRKMFGENVNKGTWKSLLKLLTSANIPFRDCFFTNAFMGLCEGADNKKYQGRHIPNFRAACLKFLQAQIGIQRPRFILTLGVHVPPLLASASSDLTAWTGRTTKRSCDPKLYLRDLDRAPIFRDARIELDNGSFHTAVVTAIAHPSDSRNAEKRTPDRFPPGKSGEIELIRAAWEASRSSV